MSLNFGVTLLVASTGNILVAFVTVNQSDEAVIVWVACYPSCDPVAVDLVVLNISLRRREKSCIKMTERYACNYNGKCETDSHGEFTTLSECQEVCQGVDNKDLHYLIGEYAPRNGMNMAPSDQVELVRRITGFAPASSEAAVILLEIGLRDYEDLALRDDLLPWLRRTHPYALRFAIPAGSLEPGVIAAYDTYNESQLTSLAVENGINLSLLDYGDIVSFEDIPLEQGKYLMRETNGLIRIAYHGLTRSNNPPPTVSINNFPRTDYWRYALPGNRVALNIDWHWNDAVVEQLEIRLWKVEVGGYRIFTHDLERLRNNWLRLQGLENEGLGFYYISPWTRENPPKDLYTEPY